MKLQLPDKAPSDWTSFNESCGTGDGTRREFKLPLLASSARGVRIMRGLAMLASDNTREAGPEGAVKEEPDGWRIETRTRNTGSEDNPETITESFVLFDTPVPHGVTVGVCAFGRTSASVMPDTLVLHVLAHTGTVAVKLESKTPPALKRRGKDFKANPPSDQEVAAGGRERFNQLVIGWNLEDSEGKPLECTAETRKRFLDLNDPSYWGYIAFLRSNDLQNERLTGFNAEVVD